MIILYTIYVSMYYIMYCIILNAVLSSWPQETAISVIMQLLHLLTTWPAGGFINNEYERYSINACFLVSHMNIKREKSMANESEKIN